MKSVLVPFFITFSIFLFLPQHLLGQQTGHITYTLNRNSNPTADQQDAYTRIEKAMDEAVMYYNTYTSITKSLTISYVPSVPTADGSFSGSIRFGESRNFMVVLTALHEIAHTVGVGSTNEYRNLIVDGVYTGTKGTATLRELLGDPDTVINGDSQHFWPYGLNYDREYRSDDDFVYHCKIVNAMYQDMFGEELYLSCYLRSVSDGTYMTAGDEEVVLHDQADGASLVRMIALGDTTTFRLGFGDQVLDIPDESRVSGVAAGLWSWNGGNHQKTVFEFAPVTNGKRIVRIKMVHSNLYLAADGGKVVQQTSNASSTDQQWEIVEEGSITVAFANRSQHRANGRIRISDCNGQITVSTGTPNRMTLLVTDIQGRAVVKQSVYGAAIMRRSEFTRGMYIFSVQGSGGALRERIVVR